MDKVNEFYKNYITHDFDSVLLNTNNDLINSYEYYIKIKEEYIYKTQVNFENYKINVLKLDNLDTKLYNKQNEKRIFITVINKEDRDNLKKDINDILINQRTLFNNFVHYINFLNENKYKFIVSSRPKSIRSIRSIRSSNSSKNSDFKLKNVISKLLDKKSRK